VDYTPRACGRSWKLPTDFIPAGRQARAYVRQYCCNTTIDAASRKCPWMRCCVSCLSLPRTVQPPGRGCGQRHQSDCSGPLRGDKQDMAYEDILETIQRAAEMGGWAVFMIHGWEKAPIPFTWRQLITKTGRMAGREPSRYLDCAVYRSGAICKGTWRILIVCRKPCEYLTKPVMLRSEATKQPIPS